MQLINVSVVINTQPRSSKMIHSWMVNTNFVEESISMMKPEVNKAMMNK